MFIPIWTETALPSIEITVLPLRYQPKLPVENSFTSASMSWPLIVILSGSAFSANCAALMGQEVLGGMAAVSPETGVMRYSQGRITVGAAPRFEAPAGRTQQPRERDRSGRRAARREHRQAIASRARS